MLRLILETFGADDRLADQPPRPIDGTFIDGTFIDDGLIRHPESSDPLDREGG